MVGPLRHVLHLAARARRDRAAGQRDGDAQPGDADRTRLDERQGLTDTPRPDGPLVWIHTGQASEPDAVREFIARLRHDHDDLSVLHTTSAPTRPGSRTQVTARLAPDENRAAIRRFLSHWTPDVAVWTEPEPRPILLAETAQTGVPLILADAGTGPGEQPGRRWWSGSSQGFLAPFNRILTDSGGRADRLIRLGARAERIEKTGYLCEGPPALPCNESERGELADLLCARPIWLAAPVHPDERDAVIAAHRQAMLRAHRLLLVLVPADIAAGETWMNDLAAQGLNVALRSAGQDPESQTQVYIADTDGEMGLWYRLAPVTFLGRSLVSTAEAGTCPRQAAALGSAILHGPHVGDQRDLFNRLDKVHAAIEVRNAGDLARRVEHLLAPDHAAEMAHAAWQIASEGAATTDRLKELILDAIRPAEDG